MTPYKDSISPFQEKVNVFSPKLENYQSKKSRNSKRMEPCKNRQENTMKLRNIGLQFFGDGDPYYLVIPNLVKH